MAEPQDITRNPDDSTTVMTWAEAGAASEPSAGLKATGMVNGVAPPADDFNWPELAQMRWLRAMWSRYLDASDLLFSSWISRNGTWSDTGVPALDGFLSDSGGIDSKVANVWLDPPSIDTGAVQVQISVTKATPHPFPATRDTFVYSPIDMLAPPTVTEGELIFLDVPVGDPAPVEPAGTVLVWRVETDATSIVDQEVLIVPIPLLRTIGILMLNAQDIEASTLAVSGTLDVGGATDLTTTLHVGGVSTLDGGAQGLAAAPLSLIQGATVAAAKSIVGDATTPLTMGAITALAKIVAAAAGIEGPASSALALPEGATVATGKALTLAGTAQVAGGPGTQVSAEALLCDNVQLDLAKWQTSDLTLPAVAGEARWNESFWSLMDGAGQIHTFDEATRGFDPSHVSANSIDDTDATCGRRIRHTEPVRITMSCRFEGDAALSNMNYRIKVTGPLGTADIILDVAFIDVINKGYYLHETIDWTPTDHFAAIDIQNYTFLARIGVTGGTVTATRVALSAVSAWQI